jgi:hypothetical protein
VDGVAVSGGYTLLLSLPIAEGSSIYSPGLVEILCDGIQVVLSQEVR